MTPREYITAMMRAVRLKRAEDALCYLSWLRDNGVSRDRIVGYLWRAALHDNLNIGLMEETQQALTDDRVDLKKLTVALACSQKFWSVREGRVLTKIVCAVQDRDNRQFSDDELLLRFEDSMNDENRLKEAVEVANECRTRRDRFSRSPWPELIDRLAVRARETPVAPVIAILRSPNLQPLCTESLLYLAVAWLFTGVWGQAIDLVSDQLEFRVAARKNENWIPFWGNETDRRFAGSWDGYANMAMMVELHGRLNVDDDGVLFRSADGAWRPVIRREAGLYMVQSEQKPRVFYEVNLANLSCTCEDFRRRTHECKHIRWARVEVEETLPFELAG